MKNNKHKEILILGGRGMLGNTLVKLFKNKGVPIHSTVSTSPGENEIEYRINNIDFQEKLNVILEEGQYSHVINCIGNIRPSIDAQGVYDSFFLNSYFPNILTRLCSIRKIRCINISTDCVFSGNEGNYSESDIPNDTSVYGMSKFLGEINSPPHLTIRTSIIGHEVAGNRKNLLDLFLSNQNGSQIQGYSNVMWNGVSTLVLSKIIIRIIDDNLLINKGLIQIGSEIIDKYSLLQIFKEVYHRDITINENKDIRSNKSIIPSKEQDLFKDLIGSLLEQVKELHNFSNNNS